MLMDGLMYYRDVLYLVEKDNFDKQFWPPHLLDPPDLPNTNTRRHLLSPFNCKERAVSFSLLLSVSVSITQFLSHSAF